MCCGVFSNFLIKKLGKARIIECRYLDSKQKYTCMSFMPRPLNYDTQVRGALFDAFVGSLPKLPSPFRSCGSIKQPAAERLVGAYSKEVWQIRNERVLET